MITSSILNKPVQDGSRMSGAKITLLVGRNDPINLRMEVPSLFCDRPRRSSCGTRPKWTQHGEPWTCSAPSLAVQALALSSRKTTSSSVGERPLPGGLRARPSHASMVVNKSIVVCAGPTCCFGAAVAVVVIDAAVGVIFVADSDRGSGNGSGSGSGSGGGSGGGGGGCGFVTPRLALARVALRRVVP